MTPIPAGQTSIRDVRIGGSGSPNSRPTAPADAPQASTEQLSELMRGLEIPPASAALSPPALYLIGRAIAEQAKRSADAPQAGRVVEPVEVTTGHYFRFERGQWVKPKDGPSAPARAAVPEWLALTETCLPPIDEWSAVWIRDDGGEGAGIHLGDKDEEYQDFLNANVTHWMPLPPAPDAAPAPPPAAEPDYKRERDAVPAPSAAVDVFAERDRQISAEGWTPEHDDEHDAEEMAIAAACYALNATWLSNIGKRELVDKYWPWNKESWKPKDARRDLVRAGALILAEIERLDRAAIAAVEKGEGR